MSPTRPRHEVTETSEVAAALDDAALRWPEDASNRAALVRRLLVAGQAALQQERNAAAEARRAAIMRTSGALSGAFDDGHLEQLREGWPA